MPEVFNFSATCDLVFLPEVPAGVVPIVIILTKNPVAAKTIEIAVKHLAIEGSRLLKSLKNIAGINEIKIITGICPRYRKKKLPVFSKECRRAITLILYKSNDFDLGKL